jgi:hypothetical protein
LHGKKNFEREMMDAGGGQRAEDTYVHGEKGVMVWVTHEKRLLSDGEAMCH